MDTVVNVIKSIFVLTSAFIKNKGLLTVVPFRRDSLYKSSRSVPFRRDSCSQSFRRVVPSCRSVSFRSVVICAHSHSRPVVPFRRVASSRRRVVEFRLFRIQNILNRSVALSRLEIKCT